MYRLGILCKIVSWQGKIYMLSTYFETCFDDLDSGSVSSGMGCLCDSLIEGNFQICCNTSITSPTARSHSELVSLQAALHQLSVSITNTNPPFPALFIFLQSISSVAGNKCPSFTQAAGCRSNHHSLNALPNSAMSFISWSLHSQPNVFQIPTSFGALFFITAKLGTSFCIGEYFFFPFKLEVAYLKTNLILIFQILINAFLPFPTPAPWCILNFQLKE